MVEGGRLLEEDGWPETEIRHTYPAQEGCPRPGLQNSDLRHRLRSAVDGQGWLPVPTGNLSMAAAERAAVRLGGVNNCAYFWCLRFFQRSASASC